MMPRPRYRLAVFDLDGTLADTRRDLAASLIRTVESLGMPRPSPRQVIAAVGWGARNLVATVLGPEHADRVDEVLAAFRADYRDNLVVDTRLFDGVEPLLRDLRRGGCTLAVATNKPSELSRDLVHRLGLTPVLDAVIGPEDVERPKPAPDMLDLLLERFGVPADAAVMVGDMETDVVCAERAGVTSVLVPWGGYSEAPGLRRRADQVAEDVRALRRVLLR